ncbi:hypothetical protein PSPO_b0766 [Pseudoalteromonas spongiae UST010723-006]|nr:hypothetical protein PSPO_b0766 [Pseudoalteromonas spongiae UST010723-006]
MMRSVHVCYTTKMNPNVPLNQTIFHLLLKCEYKRYDASLRSLSK